MLLQLVRDCEAQNKMTVTNKVKQSTKKNVGNNAFKGIHKKATIKCPSKKLKDYQTILLKKGVAQSASFKE